VRNPLWSDGWRGWLVRRLYRLCWKTIGTIPDPERLWRAFPKKEQLYPDGRIKPAFFRDSSGLSCDLARFSTPETSRLGHAISVGRNRPPGTGLVEFTAGAVRARGSDVKHRPAQEFHNYSHCQFTSNLTTAQARSLCEVATFLIPPSFEG
jgi:hypothetical protein